MGNSKRLFNAKPDHSVIQNIIVTLNHAFVGQQRLHVDSLDSLPHTRTMKNEEACFSFKLNDAQKVLSAGTIFSAITSSEHKRSQVRQMILGLTR